jgi:ribonuclease HI
VRGHNGHAENERVDQLAREAAQVARQKPEAR